MQKLTPTFQWKVLKPSKRGGVVFVVAVRGEDGWLLQLLVQWIFRNFALIPC
jgi:hypothetical protein